MIGLYSKNISIDGMKQIKSPSEEYSIIVTDFANYQLIEELPLVVIVYEKYSLKEEEIVFSVGGEYYCNKQNIHTLVNNISKKRLLKQELSFCGESLCVKLNDVDIQLSRKEFALFEFLNENRGKKCLRKDILNVVFNYHEDAETRIVDVYIKHVRTKLGEEGKKIETIRGKGYIYHK